MGICFVRTGGIVMGRFTALGSINSNYRLELEVTQTSQNIANNTSTISWVARMVHVGTAWSFSQITMRCVVNIDGVEVLNNNQARALAPGGSFVFGSGTRTIQHNADGTRGIWCSAALTMSGSQNFIPGNTTASGTLGLTTIPRQATITRADNFNDEGAPYLTFNNPRKIPS